MLFKPVPRTLMGTPVSCSLFSPELKRALFLEARIVCTTGFTPGIARSRIILQALMVCTVCSLQALILYYATVRPGSIQIPGCVCAYIIF